MLVYDGFTRKQHFFNPWGYHDHWLTKAFAQRTSLVPHFAVATVQEDSWPSCEETLQYKYDDNGLSNGSGNCVLYTVLIAAMCFRFGKGDPFEMANVFMDRDDSNLKNQKQVTARRVKMSKLWTWMNDLAATTDTFINKKSTASVKAQAKKTISSLLFPITGNPNQKCNIFCPKSGKYCSRKRCGNDIFCWQHKYSIRNTNAKGIHRRKCKMIQAKCQR